MPKKKGGYNTYMTDFYPFFTADGSVGLYNKDFDDIYHSATGALTESYEKFIYPSNIEEILNKSEINVLDICFGIGYNTKAFLNFYFEKKIKTQKSTQYYDTIDTDNILRVNNSIYNDKIYTDNTNSKIDNQADQNTHDKKIYIKGIDNDFLLPALSPFIKSDGKLHKDPKQTFTPPRVEKYLKHNINPVSLRPEVNYLLLTSILKGCAHLYNSELESIINDKNFAPYFSKEIKTLYQIFQKNEGKYISRHPIILFLHNIYYQYISNRYKKNLKTYLLENINIDIEIDDARNALLPDEKEYDLIFLDAFTPSKCPCLWSYDFFKLLYSKLNQDGMLLTYSSSASVRNAMMEAGFYVGNSYNERLQKFNGTICAKNESLIKYPLSEFDLGLLKTKAGIFYRDENLNAQNEAIIQRRNLEVKNSHLESSTKYKNSNLQK